MNKYPIIFCSLLLAALLKSNIAFSQSLTVGGPIEDAYRREQLLGRVDSNVSFTIRPLFPKRALGKDNIFDIFDDLGTGGSESNGIYKTADGKGLLQLTPVVWQQQYNTHNPYGWNDGSMIPSAGYETLVRAGFYAKYKFLSIQFQPEFVFAQNKFFDGFTQAGNDAKAWAAWYTSHNRVDLPERFGAGTYTKLLPGQSSIRLNFDPVSIGLSTENLWWGPGVRNSLIMSNTATGFAHITLNTTRPVTTPIGSFEGQSVGGKLIGSNYSPVVLGQTGGQDKLYRPKPKDWRYFSGLVVSYQPKWTPGLFLGLTRAFQIYEKDIGHGFADYFPILLPYSKTSLNNEDAKKRDQLTSVFIRWLLKDSHAELYFEYAKGDNNWNLRDLILEPEHARAYTLGAKKIYNTGRADQYLQISIEATQLGASANDVVERTDGDKLYEHYQVVDGYTNRGEALGAGIGPGGNMQSLDVTWFSGFKQIGLQLERYEHNADMYYSAFSIGELRRHWVDLNLGLHSDWTYKQLLFSAKILYSSQLNYQWKFKDDPSVFYWDQKKYDANNFQLGLSAVYRF